MTEGGKEEEGGRDGEEVREEGEGERREGEKEEEEKEEEKEEEEEEEKEEKEEEEGTHIYAVVKKAVKKREGVEERLQTATQLDAGRTSENAIAREPDAGKQDNWQAPDPTAKDKQSPAHNGHHNGTPTLKPATQHTEAGVGDKHQRSAKAGPWEGPEGDSSPKSGRHRPPPMKPMPYQEWQEIKKRTAESRSKVESKGKVGVARTLSDGGNGREKESRSKVESKGKVEPRSKVEAARTLSDGGNGGEKEASNGEGLALGRLLRSLSHRSSSSKQITPASPVRERTPSVKLLSVKPLPAEPQTPPVSVQSSPATPVATYTPSAKAPPARPLHAPARSLTPPMSARTRPAKVQTSPTGMRAPPARFAKPQTPPASMKTTPVGMYMPLVRVLPEKAPPAKLQTSPASVQTSPVRVLPAGGKMSPVGVQTSPVRVLPPLKAHTSPAAGRLSIPPKRGNGRAKAAGVVSGDWKADLDAKGTWGVAQRAKVFTDV